jgi:hypothetical protein
MDYKKPVPEPMENFCQTHGKGTLCIVLNTKNAKVFINDNDNPNDNNSFGRHTYLYL